MRLSEVSKVVIGSASYGQESKDDLEEGCLEGLGGAGLLVYRTKPSGYRTSAWTPPDQAPSFEYGVRNQPRNFSTTIIMSQALKT
jgi:hypothetical protein